MKRILFAISLMAATTASFAQVAKPMEDVNKVIDNTVDSLNKANHLPTSGEPVAREIIRVTLPDR